MAAEELKPLQVKEIIRSEIRQLPETRWIQNLRHPSYHLRQPIPILIEREGDVVAANYDDLDFERQRRGREIGNLGLVWEDCSVLQWRAGVCR